MSFRSRLYVGAVMHRRLRPKVHQFRYRAFWLLIDLDELPALTARLKLFSHNRFNLFALHESDLGDGGPTPLRIQAERLLAEAGIDIAGGIIRLLCMPRTLGYSFNPISLYYCHRPGGELAAIIYEVHNTFGERHRYVAATETKLGEIRQNCRKAFYVSPFMDMDLAYHFRLTEPTERVAVGINASKGGERVLHASLAGRRRELTDGALLEDLSRNSAGYRQGHPGDPLGGATPLAERHAVTHPPRRARWQCHPRHQHVEPDRYACHLKANTPHRDRSMFRGRRRRPRCLHRSCSACCARSIATRFCCRHRAGAVS